MISTPIRSDALRGAGLAIQPLHHHVNVVGRTYRLRREEQRRAFLVEANDGSGRRFAVVKLITCAAHSLCEFRPHRPLDTLNAPRQSIELLREPIPALGIFLRRSKNEYLCLKTLRFDGLKFPAKIL